MAILAGRESKMFFIGMIIINNNLDWISSNLTYHITNKWSMIVEIG